MVKYDGGNIEKRISKKSNPVNYVRYAMYINKFSLLTPQNFHDAYGTNSDLTGGKTAKY